MDLKLTLSDMEKQRGAIGGERPCPVSIEATNVPMSGKDIPNWFNTGNLSKKQGDGNVSADYQFGKGG